MRTATFDYTEMAVVDSSFIDAVYYNTGTSELAVSMLNGDTHFYADVPARVFYDMVDGPSAGAAYNREVKDQYTNIAGGPVHEVQFVEHEVGVTKRFNVKAVVEFQQWFDAESAADAAKQMEKYMAPNYGSVSITEVKEVG
ncbi:hypothetical protein SEA_MEGANTHEEKILLA_200 [Streptomyces phage MeganTheeKilla]|uniref:KTSC domain-containing protein n=1 Tax=Streptomyces phage MeganTheeKilla TaxID=2801897 RepID=A0A7U0GC73_9CAUD|nr:hypothetical protein SEA_MEGANTHEEKILLA_200 [Streptomyces phage MeganTheeKilla]